MSRTSSIIPLNPLARALLRTEVARLKQREMIVSERQREAWLNQDALNWSLASAELAQVRARIRELEAALSDGT